jgi:hypothetical protein
MPNMRTFKEYLTESAKSDQYEQEVAQYINSIDGITAERPSVSTAYSDVLLTLDGGSTTWLEVKMNHTDNLSNPRIFFDGKKWDTTYTTPVAKFAVEQANKSKMAKDFIKTIAKFSGIKNPKIPTTKSGLRDKNAVPLKVMKEFFAQPGMNRYIVSDDDMNLGKLVTDHYLKGKAEPAHYMQAGDDFYMVGSKNPFGVPNGVPKLSGTGPFKLRVATRSAFYEVQAEVKIMQMPKSKYSLKPGSQKKNPFS